MKCHKGILLAQKYAYEIRAGSWSLKAIHNFWDYFNARQDVFHSLQLQAQVTLARLG